MQQNQPQPEFSQDHIVRRLISKFRKPSDAGAIGGLPAIGSSNTLQVPQAQHGLPTVSGTLSFSGDSGQASSDGGAGKSSDGSSVQLTGGASSAIRSLAGKQSRWSALVASAAAGAASKASSGGVTGTTSAGGATTSGGHSSSGQHHLGQQHPVSSTRSLLDISHPEQHGESSSNRSSADGRDDEVDENYFRPGGKGHQALLDNMDKR